MAARRKTLSDDDARRDAIAVHDRSFLVEAGAGSGKTAVMAGRIAMLLAEGVEPNIIAAVTFTEFAASELLIRVRAFVGALAAATSRPSFGSPCQAASRTSSAAISQRQTQRSTR